jgi:hypothetical protein
LADNGWVEGEQRMTFSPGGDRVTGCTSPYTRGEDTLLLTALNPYEVTGATLNGEALPSADAVWVAATGKPALDARRGR